MGSFQKFLKAEIIEFSKRARTKSSHSRVLLTNRLIALKRRLSLGDRSVSLEISQVEQDLKFFGLERKRASQNLVSSIYDENGVEVFSREEIGRAYVLYKAFCSY